jgi:hypothetical protein
MPPIKIPNVPKSAYDQNRDANDLLLAQIANLETALGRRPKKLKGRITEGDAAAYIRHLHRHFHHRVLLPALPKVATPVGLALAAARPAKKADKPRRKKR